MDNIFISYSLFILFLPLAAFVIQILVGKRLPRQGDWVSVGAIFITLILSIAMFVAMLLDYNPAFKQEASFTWLDMGAFSIQLGFLVDNITVIMLLVVALISTCTHVFSLKYLEGDIRYSRYFAYLGLFTFSMNGIVLANNLISMYMSWELVGVSSYLLIGHWFEKDSAANAAKKAFLTNRVGDIGFFIGIMLIYTAIGSFAFGDIFEGVAAGTLSGTTLTLAGVGLFLGAMGKSSQFPLHIWLPDAMEGPTPVSALMHAATMVAAGVYLAVRLFPLFTPEALLVIAYVGGFTALFAATIAITQNDIKKVLAYSTVSQLGYMILAVGTGVYTAAFFHLLTHAMFKANLFYGSGSVIHSMHHALHEKHDHETDDLQDRPPRSRDRLPQRRFGRLLGSAEFGELRGVRQPESDVEPDQTEWPGDQEGDPPAVVLHRRSRERGLKQRDGDRPEQEAEHPGPHHERDGDAAAFVGRELRQVYRAAAVLAAGSLTLTACGNSADPATAGSGSPATVTSVDGQQISLPANGKPTAVFFFSVGCGECVNGVRSLGEAATTAENAGTVASFLAVDMDPGESKALIGDFMESVDAEHVPAAIDDGAALSRRFEVAALSTLIVVDADGTVTFRATDPDAATITAELAKAGA